ncbi:hypothetical protein MN116_002759 [Schistosoma mekongi]|uniref:C3H1-type domain-containing protein n=1 Tax=Schistosoma mekongi TaxID=38744 RepID=A0AAE1ZG20_SCHME|nr:hypothetical protein MN116_002759 [Schistosoma mekongi]
MPPKKNEPSKKNFEKQKQKIVEDKTFGMKNKKGAKQQKFIQQVQKQVTQGNKSAKELERERQVKDDKKKEKVELNDLFKPVLELQKCAKGVDPKSVLCVFFKQGLCAKGDKCKFSHDLTVERKAEKRGIYSESDKTDSTMDDWDISKLEEVISKKHDADNRGLPPSTIVCKYFIDAVENFKYGWFWECPNGKTCHYRHALPPGFILQRDKKKMEEQKEVISIEDLVERERQALGLNQTKVTLHTFMEWKKRKRLEKMEKRFADKALREASYKQGRSAGISGREIFEFDPTLIIEAVDDDETSGVVDSRIRDIGENEDDGPVRDIDLNMFAIEEFECENNDDESKVTGACAMPGVGEFDGNEYNNDDVVIDEELFDETDLADIEAEINELELEP